MAKFRRKFLLSPRAIVLSLIILGGLSYSLYRVIPRQPANVFLVTEPTSYGEVTMAGTIYKDAPTNQEGIYYLYTADGRAITLDAVGIDPMIGLAVIVSGQLSPPRSESELPFMSVATMESN